MTGSEIFFRVRQSKNRQNTLRGKANFLANGLCPPPNVDTTAKIILAARKPHNYDEFHLLDIG